MNDENKKELIIHILHSSAQSKQGWATPGLGGGQMRPAEHFYLAHQAFLVIHKALKKVLLLIKLVDLIVVYNTWYFGR